MKKCDHHIADLRKQLASRYAAVEKVGIEQTGEFEILLSGTEKQLQVESFYFTMKNHRFLLSAFCSWLFFTGLQA